MRDPTDVSAYDDLEARQLVAPEVLQGKIGICDPDPRWPAMYEGERERLSHVLGERVRRIEHVGSTSVPGLAAKPVIDIVLEVADSSDEARYIPDLQAAGYVLTVREPEWFEHRLLKGPSVSINLHVFSAGCPETDRMVRFRDRLRENQDDRDLYASVKRELSLRDWKYVQQYADAKSDVVTEIVRRAESSGPAC
jgi:GrpB-like predicted nucleotidyltransferase (UPF0157 family)